MVKAQKAIQAPTAFYHDIEIHWSKPYNHIIGHIVYYPLLLLVNMSNPRFAVIEIDNSNINTTNFQGNVIYLGTKIQMGEFN